MSLMLFLGLEVLMVTFVEGTVMGTIIFIIILSCHVRFKKIL